MTDGPIKIPMRYEIADEFGQIIARTATRWSAECLLAGMKASGSPTWAEGRYTITKVSTEEAKE